MNIKKTICMTLLALSSNTVFAVCLENLNDFPVSYEIENKNTGCNQPAVKFHSGTLQEKERKCFGEEGKEAWFYRKDDITIMREGKLACFRQVNGIKNALSINYRFNTWWCLNQHEEDED